MQGWVRESILHHLKVRGVPRGSKCRVRRAGNRRPQCAGYRFSGSQFSAKTVSLHSDDGRGAFPSVICGRNVSTARARLKKACGLRSKALPPVRHQAKLWKRLQGTAQVRVKNEGRVQKIISAVLQQDQIRQKAALPTRRQKNLVRLRRQAEFVLLNTAQHKTETCQTGFSPPKGVPDRPMAPVCKECAQSKVAVFFLSSKQECFEPVILKAIAGGWLQIATHLPNTTRSFLSQENTQEELK